MRNNTVPAIIGVLLLSGMLVTVTTILQDYKKENTLKVTVAAQTAQTAAAMAKVKALEAENAQLNAIAVSAIAAELECNDRFDRTFKRNYAGN